MVSNGPGGLNIITMIDHLHICISFRKAGCFYQDFLIPLKRKAEHEQRPLQKVCYRDGDETGRLDLEEEWRENKDL